MIGKMDHHRGRGSKGNGHSIQGTSSKYCMHQSVEQLYLCKIVELILNE